MRAPVDRILICPMCGTAYIGHPVLSRTDGQTLICPDCGSRQAMTALGISEDEQETIIRAMHRGHNIAV